MNGNNMEEINGEDFSFNDIKDFDNHIEVSIPNYIHITDLILNLSTYFINDNSNIYDLGCSTGILLNKLSYHNQSKNNYFIGYDCSDNLLPESNGNKLFINQDITSDVLFTNTNLILSIFTLQFISIDKRIKLINKIYSNLNKGGAFIFTEKIYLENGFIQDIFNFCHYDIKQSSFTEKEILGKQMKLRRIMKPLTEKENIEILKEAGFKIIEGFFQSLNFKGWVCIK